MKIEWVEENFADLGGQDGVFAKAADRSNRTNLATQPRKMVPMMRTCHGDLVKAPTCVMAHR